MSIPYGKQFQRRSHPIGKALPTRRLKPENLSATQTTFNPETIAKIAAKDPADIDVVPVVGKLDGGRGWRVLDGHHRVSAALVRGESTIQVRVLPLDPEPTERPRFAEAPDPELAAARRGAEFWAGLISGYQPYRDSGGDR